MIQDSSWVRIALNSDDETIKIFKKLDNKSWMCRGQINVQEFHMH